jgi:hypothetical protein
MDALLDERFMRGVDWTMLLDADHIQYQRWVYWLSLTEAKLLADRVGLWPANHRTALARIDVTGVQRAPK